MGRPPRIAVGGMVYHALNRANRGSRLFLHSGGYAALEQVLMEAHERVPVRILAYCLMPTHWHLVLWPHADGDISTFLHWASLTHTQRWHAHHQCVGVGHLYQGRFKSFVIQEDEHFLTLCRYVERNALRAGLVDRAEEWRWCSLWRRLHDEVNGAPPLAQWPVPRPPDWTRWVNEAQSERDLVALRTCIKRGRPFGSETWSIATAARLGLEATLRPRGRPRA